MATGSAAAADAGPWGQRDGDLFARVAWSNEQIDFADARRVDVYAEYGLTQDWTLLAKTESVEFPNAGVFNASEARLIFQRRLYEGRRLVFAAGGGPVYGSAVGGALGCDTAGVEARTSVGTGGIIASRDWYASVDLSGRWHADGCQRRKLDIVFGIEWNEHTTFAPQVFVEQSNSGADSIAVQMEWIEHYNWFDLTFGYKYEAGDLFDQQATLIGISKRF